MMDHLFIGNAICGVGSKGGFMLPGFVQATLARRTDAKLILVGSHETDRCLVAYDPAYAATLASDCRRRRIAEELLAPHRHAARERQIFGFVEQVSFDTHGAAVLPPMMRRRARIDDAALVIGTGGAFEIWNPRLALDSDDPDLRELAAFHLEFQQAA
jgi:MraZ protein